MGKNSVGVYFIIRLRGLALNIFELVTNWFIIELDCL